MTRVLLAGELAYDPERILVLQEHGITLAGGLWIDDPLPFMTVGPLSFLPELPSVGLDDWRSVTPDVIYAGLNWRSIPLVCALLAPARRAGVPIVLHFKEAPQRCLARGDWALLARAHAEVDVRVYATALERDHLEAVLPGRADPAHTHVLDGDLPPARWLPAPAAPEPARVRSDRPATVLLGRPEGMDAAWLAGLEAAGIDLHVHHPAPPDWLTGPHVHRHPPVAAAGWAQALGVRRRLAAPAPRRQRRRPGPGLVGRLQPAGAHPHGAVRRLPPSPTRTRATASRSATCSPPRGPASCTRGPRTWPLGLPPPRWRRRASAPAASTPRRPSTPTRRGWRVCCGTPPARRACQV